MLTATKVKMSGSEKNKVSGKTYNMSFTKLVTRKCHVLLMKKQRRRNVQKSVLHVQSFFFFVAVAVLHYTIIF